MRLIYPLFVTKTVYEGQRKDRPDSRVFILTRSAFLGQQRYAAATWSGDIGNSWETLRRQIPAGLNFVATGMPYWTTDTGGFFRPGGGQYQDKGFHERFIRWFQYSTFCPLQRVHGYQTDTEFWRYGEQVEQEAKRYLDLRYRMFPYIYSEAARMTFEGSTLMRPLVMDFADDQTALEQNYEYMFGPAFLVAPVLEPGVSTWDVYLPKADEGWIDFWTGKPSKGGQSVKVASPLEQIPLQVRVGSIVPLGPKQQYIGEKPDAPIEIRVYPGADGRFVLYEDEGDNYNYEKGEFAKITLDWDDSTQTLTIGERTGEFSGMVKNRTFNVVKVSSGHGVGIDPEAKPDAVIKYTGAEATVALVK
jgi:alpha-D-xyloside xylohydrolase